jgi:hypothetical protein
VRPRGNRWRVVIEAGNDPATGKRRQRVSYHDTEAEAWEHLGELGVRPSIRPTLGGRPAPPRQLYDTAPILALLRSSPTLDAYIADRLATALGHHPGDLWPSWWDDGLDEALAG